MMKCARAPRKEKRRECRSVAPAIATTAIAYRPTDPKRSVTMLGGEPARGRASMISDRILTCDTTERASIAGRMRTRGFESRKILLGWEDPQPIARCGAWGCAYCAGFDRDVWYRFRVA